MILAVLASALTLAGPARSDTVTLKPSVHMLGEWVDGMVSDGKSIWVAEFGQRTLAQLNATYGLARRVKLPGIPDKIDLGRDGALYLLLEVEDLIQVWQQPSGGSAGRVIFTLEPKTCAPALAAGGGAFLWVLTGCGDDSDAALLKVDTKTGAKTAEHARVPLGAGGGGVLMVRQGQVWAAIDKLSVIDETTLAVHTSDIHGNFGPKPLFTALAADAGLVYAGVASDTAKLVVAVDPATLQETARAAVDQMINAIVADAQHVVALGSEGRIFVLATRTLALERVIDLTVAKVEPRAAMIRNGNLLLTDFRLENAHERGALLVLHGWRPRAAP
jgi:DNA-binding beta-propeller fold protein YncE